MAWFQQPGTKVGKLSPQKSKFFRHGDLMSLLGTDPVFLTLMWDDVVIARCDYEDESLGKNELASILLNRPVYGPALIAEPQEIEP